MSVFGFALLPYLAFISKYSRGGHALFLVNLFKKLHCAWRYSAIFYHDLVQNTTRISSWLSDFRVVSWTSSCSMSVFRYISYLFLQCSVLRYCPIWLSFWLLAISVIARIKRECPPLLILCIWNWYARIKRECPPLLTLCIWNWYARIKRYSDHLC